MSTTNEGPFNPNTSEDTTESSQPSSTEVTRLAEETILKFKQKILDRYNPKLNPVWPNIYYNFLLMCYECFGIVFVNSGEMYILCWMYFCTIVRRLTPEFVVETMFEAFKIRFQKAVTRSWLISSFQSAKSHGLSLLRVGPSNDILPKFTESQLSYIENEYNKRAKLYIENEIKRRDWGIKRSTVFWVTVSLVAALSFWLYLLWIG